MEDESLFTIKQSADGVGYSARCPAEGLVVEANTLMAVLEGAQALAQKAWGKSRKVRFLWKPPGATMTMAPPTPPAAADVGRPG